MWEWGYEVEPKAKHNCQFKTITATNFPKENWRCVEKAEVGEVGERGAKTWTYCKMLRLKFVIYTALAFNGKSKLLTYLFMAPLFRSVLPYNKEIFDVNVLWGHKYPFSNLLMHLVWAAVWQNQQNDQCVQHRRRSASLVQGICPVWSVFPVLPMGARMPWLIWVFTGHTGHFVCFVICDEEKGEEGREEW